MEKDKKRQTETDMAVRKRRRTRCSYRKGPDLWLRMCWALGLSSGVFGWHAQVSRCKHCRRPKVKGEAGQQHPVLGSLESGLLVSLKR